VDTSGNIYEVTDIMRTALSEAEVSEDQARLDGYLRGRAESDRPKREVHLSKGRKFETLVHNSTRGGTYRKENMGIEDIGELGGSEPVEPVSDPVDPSEPAVDPVDPVEPSEPVAEPAEETTEPPAYGGDPVEPAGDDELQTLGDDAVSDDDDDFVGDDD
jgi:hypothetical protein